MLCFMGRPQDPVPFQDSDEGAWCVLLEENTGYSEGKRWGLTKIRQCHSRAAALADAAMMARKFEPEHPKSERNRMIFRAGDDSWVVWVEGATQKFHFRVTVAKPEVT